MSKKRKTPAFAVLISSPLGLESALNRYVAASLDLKARKAEHEKKIAELNAQFDLENKSLSDDVVSLETGIQLYCVNHRQEIFADDKKSIDFTNATIGFRFSPHAVAKLLSKDTWDRIAERLLELEWGEPYTTISYSVNKEELLKNRADLTDAQLKEAGIGFVQNENFYIEPSSEAIERSSKKLESEVAA